MTSSEKEVLKTKTCCSCNKNKDIKDFYRNKLVKDGRMGKCKLCMSQGLSCRSQYKVKHERSGRPRKIDGPVMYNVAKEDWIEMYEFLSRIGYKLSGDKTIHEQFCERYNLRPRKRMYEKSIQYTPKDLGMI